MTELSNVVAFIDKSGAEAVIHVADVLDAAGCLLNERGNPMLCPQASGGFWAVKQACWAWGETPSKALDALDAKIKERDAAREGGST